MANCTSYWKNANKNNSEIPFSDKLITVGEGVGWRRKHTPITGGPSSNRDQTPHF